MSPMTRSFTLACAAALALTAAGGAQPSPYVDLMDRDIKALSKEQIDDLLRGKGMSLALPAELNGFPGPKHVLELAGRLALTAEQQEAVGRVHGTMLREAVELGRKIVEGEHRLDELFAGGQARPEALRTALDELGRLYAALRYAHLHAHLETKSLLTEAQTHRYGQLRGYSGESPEHRHPHGHP